VSRLKACPAWRRLPAEWRRRSKSEEEAGMRCAGSSMN
jgi:hypothetical protein